MSTQIDGNISCENENSSGGLIGLYSPMFGADTGSIEYYRAELTIHCNVYVVMFTLLISSSTNGHDRNYCHPDVIMILKSVGFQLP